MSSVAILGAGPAGLMAALAAERNGHEPVIFTKELVPSKVNEDMFLQRPLPEIHDERPEVMIDYIKWGSEAGYADLVYGDLEARTSWTSVREGKHPGWWLSPAYQRLWDRYKGCLVPLEVGSSEAAALSSEFYLTMTTLPGPMICDRLEHVFVDKRTLLVRQQREDDPRLPQEIVYNGGSDEANWFRMSKLGPWITWEYTPPVPAGDLGPEPQIFEGKKFITNTCDCHPKLFRVGRWAQWTRGVLNHHAFEQATSILASVGLGKGA